MGERIRVAKAEVVETYKASMELKKLVMTTLKKTMTPALVEIRDFFWASCLNLDMSKQKYFEKAHGVDVVPQFALLHAPPSRSKTPILPLSSEPLALLFSSELTLLPTSTLPTDLPLNDPRGA
ncbi:hypothetical protein NE237_010311 [Protea cynaroides]|uniref:Uncharacterized protein n=1 Tax=Protea cynaroides TaxID=273540 RepID=A0A9Q0L005_9MAGN|nr:hypothetical protein NE237_010311 [Protea cynaroides]